jgi:hypothetical protein
MKEYIELFSNFPLKGHMGWFLRKSQELTRKPYNMLSDIYFSNL